MDIREKTFEELIYNLNKYGKSALVRSTGFGKTFMLTNLIKLYKKVLFLYPTQVIKNTVIKKYCEDKGIEPNFKSDKLEHITFMTYYKLINLKDEQIEKMDYDLIIFDECHRTGAKLTKEAIYKMFNKLPNTHFVGSTATPNRGDAFDIIDIFFDNINVSEYTLHDSFKDGILQKPYYVYFSYDNKDKIRHEIKEFSKREEMVFSKEENKLLDKKVIEIANLYNIEYVIEEATKQHIKDTSYMKFICFFNNFKHTENKSKDVIGWFKKAFPNHTIRTLVINSKTSENSKNVIELEGLERKENTIDLIFCINMLNMGYHVDDITGIIMYRCTQSNIIYIQQLGRALSSGASNSCIIFDIVDNIKRGSVFDTYDRNTVNRLINKYKKEEEELLEKINESKENEDIAENNEKEEYYWDLETKTMKKKWWRRANDLLPEDLNGAGIIASYKELIKKVVAETMLQRCKIAFTSHFRYWCEEKNVPFPISVKELHDVYGLDKKEFNDYFYNLVKNNNFNYPLGDAELLKKEGLDLIAKIWNLTSEKICEVLLNA